MKKKYTKIRNSIVDSLVINRLENNVAIKFNSIDSAILFYDVLIDIIDECFVEELDGAE